MITIISQKAANTFHPASNPINITVNSNNSGKCNFRYVCDIKINGTSVFKDKLFPDPATGYGFFQLNRIIQDYIDNYITKTQPTVYFNVAADGSAPDAVVSVQCVFGEEYDASLNCSGTISQYLGLATTNLFYAFNGAIDYESFLTWNYTKYMANWSSTPANTLFLTNSPREVEVTFNEPYYLDFMSLIPPTIKTTSGVGYVAMRVLIKLKNGTVQTNLFDTTSMASRKRFRLAVGPLDLNRITGMSVIDDNIASYKVCLVWAMNNAPAKPSIVSVLSEEFTFKVVRPKTFSTRLGFVGRLGSPESFTFYHRNMASYNITRSTYNKLLQTNYNGSLTYQVGDRSASTYNMQAVENHRVSTYCNRDMSEFLYEMWLSGDVWVYDLPKIMCFHTYTDGLGNLFFVLDTEDHGLNVGDFIFFTLMSGPDNTYPNPVKKVITYIDGRNIKFGDLIEIIGPVTPIVDGYSGWLHKDTSWRKLPIVISDNTIEVKQKMTKPIEYTLSYSAAYNKYTSI